MDSKKYLDDISEIKNMMSKSSRFMSLSGLSGILAGVYALIGAYLAHNVIHTIKTEQNGLSRFFMTFGALDSLLIIALSVMVLALITGTVLTYFKAKKSGEKNVGCI